MESDDTQLTTDQSQPQDIAAYYQDAAHGAHSLLKNALVNADDDFRLLAEHLKAVNAYIKAREGIGKFMEKVVETRSPEVSWDPFSSQDPLDTRLQVVQAKAEFMSVVGDESTAIALYQAGLSYNEIVENTGLSKAKVQRLVKRQGIQRIRKKSVPVIK